MKVVNAACQDRHHHRLSLCQWRSCGNIRRARVPSLAALGIASTASVRLYLFRIIAPHLPAVSASPWWRITATFLDSMLHCTYWYWHAEYWIFNMRTIKNYVGVAFRIAPWPLTNQVNCRLTVWLHPYDSHDRLTTSWPRSQLWTWRLWEWPPLGTVEKKLQLGDWVRCGSLYTMWAELEGKDTAIWTKSSSVRD